MADDNKTLSVAVELTPSPSKEEFQRNIDRKYDGLELPVRLADDAAEVNATVKKLVEKVIKDQEKQVKQATKHTVADVSKEINKIQTELKKSLAFDTFDKGQYQELAAYRTEGISTYKELRAEAEKWMHANQAAVRALSPEQKGHIQNIRQDMADYRSYNADALKAEQDKQKQQEKAKAKISKDMMKLMERGQKQKARLLQEEERAEKQLRAERRKNTQELEDQRQNIQTILALQERLRKLVGQTANTGISLDTSEAKARDLLKINPENLSNEELKTTKRLLGNAVTAGTAKFDTFNRANETATQMSNLNSQMTKYIELNTKLGKNRGLQAAFKGLHKQVQDNNIEVGIAQKRFAELRAEAARLGLETESLSTRIQHLFRDHLKTAISMVGVHLLERSVDAMVDAVIRIDAAMTELKKVTNETSLAYERFLDRAADKAQKLGATISDVVTATAEFARLGFSMGDAEQLADAALVYKNVGDGITDISVASESIISTMQAFGYTAEQAMLIVDKFNRVGNNFAISSGGAGEAMQRSASALKQAGNSLDEALGLIAASNTILQNPESVGTALKTLSLRLTKTSMELEELGEDTDYAKESTADYRAEILAATQDTSHQVDILDEATGKYKSTYTILQELASVWKEIDAQDQQALMYSLGGARQVNALSAILNNFDIAEKAMETSSKAAGSALEENEKYLDSINGKIDRLTATLESLFTNILNSELVAWMVDGTNSTLQFVTALEELVGIVPLLYGAFSGIMAMDGKTLFAKNPLLDMLSPLAGENPDPQQATLFSRMKNNFSLFGMIPSASDDTKALSEVLDKLKDYGDSPSKFFDSIQDMEEKFNPSVWKQISAIFHDSSDISGRTKGIEAFAEGLKDSGKWRSELTKKIFTFGKYMAIAIAVGAAFKAISVVIDEAFLTLEERQDIINDYTDKIGKAEEELKQLRELQESGAGIEEDKQRIAYLEAYVSTLKTRREEQQRMANRVDLLGDRGVADTFTPTTSTKTDRLISSNASGLFTTYAKYLYDPQDTNSQTKANEMYLRVLDEQIELLKIKEQLEDALRLEKALDPTEQSQAHIKLYESELEKVQGHLDKIQYAIDAGKDAGIISVDAATRLKEALEGANTQAQSLVGSWNLFNSVEGAANTQMSKINSELDEMQSAFSTVIAAKQEYDAYQSYSLDTLQALADLDSRYLNLLIDEQGRLELNTEAMNNLAQARINEFRIKIMTDAAQQIQNLIDTGNATAWLAQQQADLNVETYEGAKATLALAAGQAMLMGGDMATAAQMILNQTNALLNAVGAWDGYGASGSAALNKINDAAEKARKEAEDNLRKQGEAALAALDKKKKALQDELDALEEIYEAEDKEFELQKRINAYQAAQANKTVRLYTHDKGWQWVADPEKVKEAQDAVEDYLKELKREEAKKAIQDQIDAIDDLRDKVQEAMDAIGNDYINNRNNLALMAQLEGMTLEQLGGWVGNYATNVINANANIAASYDKAAAHAAAYFKTVKEESIVPEIPAQTPTDPEPRKSGIGPQVRHKGGLIQGVSAGANVSVEFDKYIKKLKSDEVPAILQVGEYVLTKQHQADILNDRANLINSVKTAGTTALSIGDIVITNPVGNVESLSRAIIQKLPNQIMKDLYSK